MPVNFGVGFNITAKESIDARIVLSKQEMRTERYALTGDTIAIPDNYLCICSDDNRLYIYNDSNPISEETGRFKLESGLTSSTVSVAGESFDYLLKDNLKIQVESARVDKTGQDINEALSQKQPLITLANPISADKIDDSISQHKFVTAGQIESWTNKQDELPYGSNDTFLHRNSSTGDLEWIQQKQITVDAVLSRTSTNPVQNKVITQSVNETNQSIGLINDTLAQKQDMLPAGNNDTFLHKNSDTGELEWVTQQGQITIDDAISPTSTNPVQNKVIYQALQDIALNPQTYVCGEVSQVDQVALLQDIQQKRPIIIDNILYQYQKQQTDISQENTSYAVYQSMDWTPSFLSVTGNNKLIFKFILITLIEDNNSVIPTYISQYNVKIYGDE